MDFTITIKGATPELMTRLQRDLPAQLIGAEATFNAIQPPARTLDDVTGSPDARSVLAASAAAQDPRV